MCGGFFGLCLFYFFCRNPDQSINFKMTVETFGLMFASTGCLSCCLCFACWNRSVRSEHWLTGSCWWKGCWLKSGCSGVTDSRAWPRTRALRKDSHLERRTKVELTRLPHLWLFHGHRTGRRRRKREELKSLSVRERGVASTNISSLLKNVCNVIILAYVLFLSVLQSQRSLRVSVYRAKVAWHGCLVTSASFVSLVSF